MELNYKIRQLDEEWKIFNDCVTRMDVYYEIELSVPVWLDLDNLGFLNNAFENLELKDIQWNEEERKSVYLYNICVSSMAKCDLSKDEFSEIIGVYICETRAEIKVLEKVKRVLNSIYKTVESKNNKDRLDDIINVRLEKNKINLERLKENID